eukprot:TRINITY_DN26679_c0_g1_i1.p1 TRINITY_DN26679_c0_g1~~TRINITY_DN26679_c0_g1_i1.p1  ORF type:complete len:480 (+),score=134.20 TRINITY_DN26679_c0_g1_i1:27-1466(+)
MLLIILLSTTILLTSSSCPPGMLVVYRLSLSTEWDEKTFPKQFPQWRPSAQWSKTVGYSHSSRSPLFSIGSTVSEGVREFAETGSTDTLDQEAANISFLDTIISPPIEQGVGETSTNIFVDTNHTMVSVMTKIVPSPDWFIGLDSLDLCSQGAFRQSVTTEAFPLDAGTDNGFTFTSPNWATEPRGEVFRMTSQFPTHPAGSFNYPHLDQLPTIAVFQLTKLREYVLQENGNTRTNVFTERRDLIATGDKNPVDQDNSVTKSKKTSELKSTNKFRYNVSDKSDVETQDIIEFVPVQTMQKEKKQQSDIVSNEIPLPEKHSRSKKKKVTLYGAKPSAGFTSFSSRNGYHASTSPENFFKKKYESEYLSKAQRKVFSGTLDGVPKSELYQHIMAQYKKGGIRQRKKKFRKRKHRKHRKPRNCAVSAWSAWGPCTKTCGIGESSRSRLITRHPLHGGHPCPALTEYKWCGSARNCKKGYFKW